MYLTCKHGNKYHSKFYDFIKNAWWHMHFFLELLHSLLIAHSNSICRLYSIFIIDLITSMTDTPRAYLHERNRCK